MGTPSDWQELLWKSPKLKHTTLQDLLNYSLLHKESKTRCLTFISAFWLSPPQIAYFVMLHGSSNLWPEITRSFGEHGQKWLWAPLWFKPRRRRAGFQGMVVLNLTLLLKVAESRAPNPCRGILCGRWRSNGRGNTPSLWFTTLEKQNKLHFSWEICLTLNKFQPEKPICESPDNKYGTHFSLPISSPNQETQCPMIIKEKKEK